MPSVNRSLTEQAYADIKQRVLGGGFSPGAVTDVNALCDALDVGRTPVREALLRLQEEGLVEVLPKRGIRIVPLSPGDLQALYQVVTALEVEAVGCVAHARCPADLDALRETLDALRDALLTEDVSAWIASDERFHRLLLERCRNPILTRAGLGYRDRCQRAHHVAIRLLSADSRAGSAVAHSELVELIEAGDEAGARACHHRQRARGSAMLVDIVAQHGLLAL